jgi:predicted amidophosphoribosyltransferase
VSPRSRPITPEEAETRRIAYALKMGEETELAACEMAELLPSDLPTLTLVPVPASTGSIEANLIFARAIAAEYGLQARVVPALNRVVPVESSCARRRRGLPGLTAADHAFVRVGGWFALPVFVVDNVATTGATLAAARHALGFGTGLVFADASPIYQPPAK